MPHNIRTALIVFELFMPVAPRHHWLGDQHGGDRQASAGDKQFFGVIRDECEAWQSCGGIDQITHFHWHTACRYNIAKRRGCSAPMFCRGGERLSESDATVGFVAGLAILFSHVLVQMSERGLISSAALFRFR